MSDPFLVGNAVQRELQQLRKENRDLREANAKLQLASRAKSTTRSEDGAGSKPASVASARVASVAGGRAAREADLATSSEVVALKRDLSNTKQVLKLFVTEVVEREAVYKQVLVELQGEVEEAQAREIELQERLTHGHMDPAEGGQLSSMPAPGPPSLVASSETSEVARAIMDNMQCQMRDLVSLLGGELSVGEVVSRPALATRQRASKKTTSSATPRGRGGVGNAPSTTSLDAQSEASWVSSQAPASLNLPSGAGQLRSVDGDGQVGMRRRPRSNPSAKSSTAVRKARKETGSVAGRGADMGQILFNLTKDPHSIHIPQFQFQDAVSTRSANDVAVATATRLGDTNPMGDYMAMAPSATDAERRLLMDQLCSCFASNPNAIALAAAHQWMGHTGDHRRSLSVLWRQVECVRGIRLMESSRLAECLFCEVCRKLPSLHGQEAGLDTMRILAIALRFLYVQEDLRHPFDVDPVSPLLYALAIRVLQISTGSGREGVSGSNESVDASQPLRAWMIVARFLSGFDEEIHLFLMAQNALATEGRWGVGLRQHTPASGVEPASRSLVSFMLQAVLSSRWTEAQGCHGGEWLALCASLGWSGRQLPLERLRSGVMAALTQTAASPTASSPLWMWDAPTPMDARMVEAVLALRLYILHKGFAEAYVVVQEMKEQLGPSEAVTPCAVLLSWAVMDLPLVDPRDGQWGYSMAFFEDYLDSPSRCSHSSAEQVMHIHDSHLIVLRAIIAMCVTEGEDGLLDGPRSSVSTVADSTRTHHVAGAVRWWKRQHAALEEAERVLGKQFAYHPLRDFPMSQTLRRSLK